MTPSLSRAAANAAEVAALSLRRLSRSLEHPERRGDVGAAILAQDRRDAVGALDRLADALDGADAEPHMRARPRTHARVIMGARLAGTIWADICGAAADDVDQWATAWDAYAAMVDP